MITPAPTTVIDPSLARGTLTSVVPATATKPGYITVGFPNTSYDLHLLPTVPVKTPVGKKIMGTIHARARRIDEVKTGGRYVEPVFGRPRRVQGSVVAVDPTKNTVVVSAGVPFHCSPTDARQKAGDFVVGQFVSFDVLDGASFTPVA